MHTLWLREHNRLAEYIFRNVPNKTDEFYYQHARRIVIAEMQHIIYNEYLPVIIGTMLFFNLLLKSIFEIMCILQVPLWPLRWCRQNMAIMMETQPCSRNSPRPLTEWAILKSRVKKGKISFDRILSI